MQKVKETLRNLEQVHLSDEEHLLRVLIDHIPDFIYIKDIRSKYVLANKKIAQVHHLESPGDIVGKTDHDFYPKELADKYYRDEQEIMATSRPMINQEEIGLDEKGYEINLSTTKIPLKDKMGNVIGLVGIGRDITHLIRAETILVERSEELERVNKMLEEKQEEIKQQAEELKTQAEHLTRTNRELEKLTVAVSETDNVVIIMDAEGNFEWVNKSFTRIYGLTLEQWIRERGGNILSGSHNPDIEKIVKQCRKTGKSVRYQSEAENKDGHTIWTQSTLTPVFSADGKIEKLVAIDSEITALKKAQDLIQQQRNELESRRDQLEKANNTKDKLFSIIAHDLKNPFNSILGFTDLLTKNYSDIDDEKKKQYLGLVNESARNAQDLLDNLLNWSRAQSGTLRYVPSRFDIHPVVEETCQFFLSQIMNKKIEFNNNIPEGSFVFADRNMIHTVIRNIVNNAIKYTPEGGTITVESESPDGTLKISIRDTGVGIPSEAQDKILSGDEFLSTPGTDGEQGTGLGLIICNDFINRHGGMLDFKSVEGKGTTFSFSLQQENQV